MTQAPPVELSVIIPAYNESVSLRATIGRLQRYLDSAFPSWEILIVNDGSRDDTGALAQALAAADPRVRVCTHPRNFGLGQAFRTGFAASRGAYVVTLDADLSYGPEHIGAMLTRMRETRAKLVLASPYMPGGELTAVPAFRRWLSIGANVFLRIFARSGVSTITGMVRAYDGPFIRSLDLRSLGMDVMPEVIYKTMILRGRIEEVPGHLDWTEQRALGGTRVSSMKVSRHLFATIVACFVFRPVIFFIVPGLLILLFALWVNAWTGIHFLRAFGSAAAMASDDRLTFAMQVSYGQFPYTFIVGLLSLMLSMQLIGLGILALQAKHNFEELFHLGTTVRRQLSGEFGRPNNATAPQETGPARDPGASV